jgi:DNA polymerase III gamma/tau subunit
MVDLSLDQVERLQQQAAGFSEQDLLALIDRAGRHFERIHRSTQPRILLEASVVEYCRFESRVLLSDLAHRLQALGAGGASGAAPSGVPRRQAANPAAPGQGGMTARPAPAAQAAPTPGTGAAAAAGSTVQGWTQLIDVLMKKAPRVGACLMEGLPELDAAAGRLTVAFAEDKKFQVTSIQAECHIIEEAAATLYGKTVKVELVLGSRGQAETVKEEIRQEVAPTAREELDRACQADQALGKLVETMDGQPLPESEREKWEHGDD